MQIIPFKPWQDRLFADLKCTCNNIITLTGYPDDYFFNKVFAVPQARKCNKCKKEHTIKWTREGVKVWVS